jgi:hypothetical protein
MMRSSVVAGMMLEMIIVGELDLKVARDKGLWL